MRRRRQWDNAADAVLLTMEDDAVAPVESSREEDEAVATEGRSTMDM